MKKLFAVILTPLMLLSTAVQAEAVKGDVEAGAKKVAMCIGCHGIPGYRTTFPLPHNVPMISGQSAGYIASALEAYKKGTRKYPTMRGIAVSLTDQDIADIAAFYAQDGQGDEVLAAVEVKPSEEMVELFNRDPANNCTTCHGVDFKTPNAGNVPILAGQHADYLALAMKAYTVADNKNFGRSHAIMGTSLQKSVDGEKENKFSKEDLEKMADYISELPSPLKVVSQKFKE